MTPVLRLVASLLHPCFTDRVDIVCFGLRSYSLLLPQRTVPVKRAALKGSLFGALHAQGQEAQ